MVFFEILFEFFRVLIILLFLFGIFYYPINKLYLAMGIETGNYLLIVTIALLLLVYIIYANKLQFTGFYTRQSKKLSKKITWSIFSASILLLLVPIVIHFWK